jgi:hypothetical protein
VRGSWRRDAAAQLGGAGASWAGEWSWAAEALSALRGGG